MDRLMTVFIVISLFAVLAGIIAILISRSREKKIICKLSKMLESAIDGSFTETLYNESTLSALETKLNRYLSQCLLSSKNLKHERDKIESLVSDISHQTKTPISNILLYSSLLSEQKNLTADAGNMVRQIYTQSEKLRFLIEALIKASRLETGSISLSPAKNSIPQLVETVLLQIEPKARAKEIIITKDIPEIAAQFDPRWTSEALYNILDNGVKYTRKGGRISINAVSYELFSRIDITDNGIGIAEEEHSKIFMRFYRSNTVQQEEGVGLGLFLTREIISKQGGYIKVSSKSGQGSTFSVFLPKTN
ncbi:MAG: HAMP domain-containing sensor histidine kinase [Clostridiaceae bacterium]